MGSRPALGRAGPGSAHQSVRLPGNALVRLIPSGLSPDRPVRARFGYIEAPTVRADMHACHELAVVVRGQLYLKRDEAWERIGPGQALVCASLEPHTWRTGAEGIDHLGFHFLPTLVQQLPVLEGFDLMAPFRSPARFGPVGRGPGFRRRLLRLARQVARRYRKRPAADAPRGYYWMATSPGQALFDLIQVLGLVAGQMLRETRAPVPPAPRAQVASSIAPAIELVEKRPDRIVTIDEAARACHMARRTFCRAFRTTVGLGFGQFAFRWRLTAAANALRRTEATLKEVAHQFGFGGASHLHAAFVRHYGMTPGQYRAIR